MEAREKLARHQAEMMIAAHESKVQAFLHSLRNGLDGDFRTHAEALDASRESLVVLLLGDSHRPVSGSEPEKAPASFLDLHGEADKAREINRRLSEEVEAIAERSVAGSGSPHRSEALEIREGDLDLIDECLDLYAQRISHGDEIEREGCCFGHDTLIDAREALDRLYKVTSGAPASDGREGARNE